MPPVRLGANQGEEALGPYIEYEARRGGRAYWTLVKQVPKYLGMLNGRDLSKGCRHG